MTRPALETERCARCGMGTAFEWDDFEGAFVSVCCTAREKALPADAEREPPDA